MKKLASALLCILLCLSLVACGDAANRDRSETAASAKSAAPTEAAALPSEPSTPAPTASPVPAETPAPVTYPYLDEAGYYHYRIWLNGEPLPLEHDALLRTSDNEWNEIVYPLSEILDYFGVAYYLNAEKDEFSSVINGVMLCHEMDATAMYFDNLGYWYGNSVMPEMINGAFYAPNYAFEHTIGAVLTKIPKGAEERLDHVDITTGSTDINWGEGAATPNILYYESAKG